MTVREFAGWVVIVFGVHAVALEAVHADDSGDARIAAKRLVDDAMLAEKDRRWADAARLHRRAFAQRPHPALLFNIAQAYRHDGQRARSLVYYRLYLQAGADSKLLDASRRYEARLATAVSEADVEAAAEAIAKEEAALGGASISRSGAEEVREDPNAMRERHGVLEGQARKSVRQTFEDVRVVDGLGFLQPDRRSDGLALELATQDLDSDVAFVALARGQATLWAGFGALVAIPMHLSSTTSDVELGNGEVGVSYRVDAWLHRWLVVAAVALPTTTVDDAGDGQEAAYGQAFGDVMRLAWVVPGQTTFRMAASAVGRRGMLHYRGAAEIDLFAGGSGGAVLGRFDGEVGFHYGVLTVSASAVTRVGGVLADVGDDIVTQLVGGVVAVELKSFGSHREDGSYNSSSRMTGYVAGGMPILSLGERRPVVMLGATWEQN